MARWMWIACLALACTTGLAFGQEAGESVSNPTVVIKTSVGEITVELYADKAPVTVENFLQYVDDGHYDGTVFHRVIKGFMIQGGGFDTSMNQRDVRDAIKNEVGTLAMARTSVVDSATAQFFINTVNNSNLNFKSPDPRGFGYCVFGKVIDGMDAVKNIESVSTATRGMYQNVPVETVSIESVTRK